MDGRKNIRGLIDSTSSRFLRANRSRLVPDLDKVKIHERLEELLVFEILKDGCVSSNRRETRCSPVFVFEHVAHFFCRLPCPGWILLPTVKLGWNVAITVEHCTTDSVCGHCTNML